MLQRTGGEKIRTVSKKINSSRLWVTSISEFLACVCVAVWRWCHWTAFWVPQCPQNLLPVLDPISLYTPCYNYLPHTISPPSVPMTVSPLTQIKNYVLISEVDTTTTPHYTDNNVYSRMSGSNSNMGHGGALWFCGGLSSSNICSSPLPTTVMYPNPLPLYTES